MRFKNLHHIEWSTNSIIGFSHFRTIVRCWSVKNQVVHFNVTGQIWMWSHCGPFPFRRTSFSVRKILETEVWYSHKYLQFDNPINKHCHLLPASNFNRYCQCARQFSADVSAATNTQIVMAELRLSTRTVWAKYTTVFVLFLFFFQLIVFDSYRYQLVHILISFSVCRKI